MMTRQFCGGSIQHNESVNFPGFYLSLPPTPPWASPIYATVFFQNQSYWLFAIKKPEVHIDSLYSPSRILLGDPLNHRIADIHKRKNVLQ